MAEVNSGNIAARAKRLAQPLAEAIGLTLWDVRFIKEGANWYLRFWIDKPGGVDLDDCEAMSRALDAPLDEADLIAQAYHLEVCSPGIERELTREEHFSQFVGSLVTVKISHPAEEVVGTLEGYEGKEITLRMEDGTTRTILRTKTTVVRLYDIFEDDGEDDFDENEAYEDDIEITSES